MISHKYKCIFIHIPKCAGTSIESALGHLDGHTGRGGQDHRTIRMIEQPVINPNIFSNKENIIEVLRRIKYKTKPVLNPNNKLTVTNDQFREYFKFTIVRNPWARAFSWYKNVMRDEIHKRNLNIEEEISFNRFLQKFVGKGMLRPQTFWLKSFDGKIHLDFVGKFESLQEDFGKVCEILSISQIELPHKIKGSSDDYQYYYDKESMDLISKFYEVEIDLFGYSFNSK